jgi:hypothetical protein
MVVLMTTKAVTGITIKNGKITRKIGFRAGIKKRNAARLAKQWQAKSARAPNTSQG